MDHSYIEGAGLIDRYVTGRLPVEERVAFEEHFLDCPECLDHLEIARSFMEGVKITAAEAVERPGVAKPSLGALFGTWFGARPSWRMLGLAAAACLFVLAVPIAVLVQQLERARSELGLMKIAANRQAGPAVFVLNEVRGLDTAQTGPANRITIPKSPRWIVFAMERDFSQYRTYRVALQSRDGKTVWQQDNIAASSPDALGVSLPSTILSAGDYTVSLAALTPVDQVVPLAKYSFRAAE